jgi:hypothetical protein
MKESKQLEECQRHTDAAHPKSVSRMSPSGSPVEYCAVYFDWEIPELPSPHQITFLARVRSTEGERSLRIPIDVASLAAQGKTADLETLHAILSARHAGLDDPNSLLLALEWLLAISLEQTQPQLSPAEQQAKMRQLLLFYGHDTRS